MYEVADVASPTIYPVSMPYLTRSAAEAYLSRVMGRDVYYGPQAAAGRYIVREVDWKRREQRWFDEGHYDAPVWSREPWWLNNRTIHGEHYVHVSLDDPAMLAFTENADKGQRDIQTRLKPGKYLKRFFGDILSDAQVTFYAEWQAKGERPAANDDLLFASTQDEIVEVYQDGPSSCMRDMDCVRVYAAGDLAVAYLSNELNGVYARALCWPERKVYGRVYPDDGNGEALIASLRSKGYVSLREKPDGFDGARLLALEGDEGEECYVMPYLDNSMMVTLNGNHFTMHRQGDFDAQNTHGYINLRDLYGYCDRCDDSIWSSDDAVTVLLGQGSYNGVTWCQNCADDNTFWCEATEETYADSVGCTSCDGRTVADFWAESNASYCDYTGEWTENDVVEMFDGDMCSLDHLAYKGGFVCPHDDLGYLPGDLRQLDAGSLPGMPAGTDDDAAEAFLAFMVDAARALTVGNPPALLLFAA
jgi:hypothetical protein